MSLADEMVFFEWEKVALQIERHSQTAQLTDWMWIETVGKGRILFVSAREIPDLCLSDGVVEQWKVCLQMVGKGMMGLAVDGMVAMIIVIHVFRSGLRLQSFLSPPHLSLPPPLYPLLCQCR